MEVQDSARDHGPSREYARVETFDRCTVAYLYERLGSLCVFDIDRALCVEQGREDLISGHAVPIMPHLFSDE